MSPTAKFALYLGFIIILLLMSSFFSCCDMVYAAAPQMKLKRTKGKAAKKALSLTQDYQKTIVAILFGNNLVNILASSLGAALSRVDMAPMNQNREMAALIIEIITLLVVLIFGEILPKVVGRTYAFRLSMAFAGIVSVIGKIFLPFVTVITFIAKSLTKPLFSHVKEESNIPSDEELQAMVDTIEEEGIIDEDQSEMLSWALQFKDTEAYEIMTPRVKMEAVEYGANLRSLAEKGAFHHSRIPVYKKNYDNIIGYLPLKQLQKSLLLGKQPEIDELMLPIVSVPRTMEISAILALLKKNHRHIALVKDEYGGNEGILTLEDILEELVGEMWDESEAIAEDVTRTEKRNVYSCRGGMSIEEFFTRFGLDLDDLDEGYETLSGWINSVLSKFAQPGDHFSYKKLDITVKKATPYTVEVAEVRVHPRRKVD